MITIRITNIDEIVTQQKGWFVAHVVGAVVDLEPKVEDVVIEKLVSALAEQGIVATIERVPTPLPVPDAPGGEP
jgi:hypothetical protein